MHIAQAFAAMDSTTKRLRIGDALTNMFRAVMLLSPDDLQAAAYLACGKVAAEYEGVELQVGGSTVVSAVVDCTGTLLHPSCCACMYSCTVFVFVWVCWFLMLSRECSDVYTYFFWCFEQV